MGSIDEPNDWRNEVLRIGLGQIPKDGLERLRQHILGYQPLLLNGEVFDPASGYV